MDEKKLCPECPEALLELKHGMEYCRVCGYLEPAEEGSPQNSPFCVK
jgi:uncharacterized Zn finger protein (UPF0148 family)